VNGQLHAPAALTPGKRPRYPLDRRLGGPRGGLHAVATRKKSLAFAGNRTPVVQPVAYPFTD